MHRGFLLPQLLDCSMEVQKRAVHWLSRISIEHGRWPRKLSYVLSDIPKGRADGRCIKLILGCLNYLGMNLSLGKNSQAGLRNEELYVLRYWIYLFERRFHRVPHLKLKMWGTEIFLTSGMWILFLVGVARVTRASPSSHPASTPFLRVTLLWCNVVKGD